MSDLTPGRAQAAFCLLDVVSDQRLAEADLRRSFSRLMTMPCHEAIALAQSLGWIEQGPDGILKMTESGRAVREIGEYPLRLRQALRDYTHKFSPPWLASAAFGRSKVLRFVDRQLAQVFSEAGLSTGTDAAVVQFWDEWADAARNANAKARGEVGREGERLTFLVESERTQFEPRWIALENNAAGYDVLSVWEQTLRTPLAIEVKATRYGFDGKCHITRNEWSVALQAREFVFDLWQLEGATPPLLARLTVGEVAQHMPVNNGAGEWEAVEIPFNAFAHRFFAYDGSGQHLVGIGEALRGVQK